MSMSMSKFEIGQFVKSNDRSPIHFAWGVVESYFPYFLADTVYIIRGKHTLYKIRERFLESAEDELRRQ